MTLPDGLYDLLLTERLLAGLDLERADLDAFNGDRAELLLDALARQFASALEDAAVDEPGPAPHQVELVNALLVQSDRRVHSRRGTQARLTSRLQDCCIATLRQADRGPSLQMRSV